MTHNQAFVNTMTLAETRRAIALAESNLAAVKPETRPNVESLLEALRERERRLVATNKRIEAVRRAR
jgi:hypothetical protein